MSNLSARLAALPADERRAALQSLSPKELREMEHAWVLWARPEQLPPKELLAGTASIWAVIAGRGFGKTRTGAETVRAEVESGRRGHVIISAPTATAIRRDLVEGPSGLLATAHPDWRPTYEPSSLRLTYPNGARCYLVSAEETDRLRGLNADFGWLDEFGAMADPQAVLDQSLLAMRITGPKGDAPWLIITTTPRPVPAMRKLLSPQSLVSGRVVVTRGSTLANSANLDSNALAMLKERYEGTRIGRQELDGALLLDTPGALWTHEMLDAHRVREAPELRRIVIGVDPAGSASKTSDETGIIAVGIAADKHAYVLRDASGRYSPQEWARRANALYEELNADAIVVEKNFGGDMVSATLTASGSRARIKAVTASRGKAIRAEPVVSKYEQGMVHHVGAFAALEDQLTSWSPTESTHSPDRLDALVWACTHLTGKPSIMDMDWAKVIQDEQNAPGGRNGYGARRY